MTSTSSNIMLLLVEVLECKKLASASKASPMKSAALRETTESVRYTSGKVVQAFIENYVGARITRHHFHNSLKSYGCVHARWFNREGAEQQ